MKRKMTDLALGAKWGGRAAYGLSGSMRGARWPGFAGALRLMSAVNATAPNPPPVRMRKSRRDEVGGACGTSTRRVYPAIWANDSLRVEGCHPRRVRDNHGVRTLRLMLILPTTLAMLLPGPRALA